MSLQLPNLVVNCVIMWSRTFHTNPQMQHSTRLIEWLPDDIQLCPLGIVALVRNCTSAPYSNMHTHTHTHTHLLCMLPPLLDYTYTWKTFLKSQEYGIAVFSLLSIWGIFCSSIIIKMTHAGVTTSIAWKTQTQDTKCCSYRILSIFPQVCSY